MSIQNSIEMYVPTCQECKGVLSIKINPLNFSIEYICEKDKSHTGNNIFFKTFERFYLKEKQLKFCSKCQSSLENSESFSCEDCKCLYCSKCYIEDIQLNGHKNTNNYKNYRCLIHNNDFTEYCLDCKKNICFLCAKSGEHKNHSTKCFTQVMPYSIDIDNLKNIIKEKTIFINKLIEKIDNWNLKINQKIKELKQNLQDEISLLKKIILNYNNNFRNYTYFQNFNYLIQNINNKSDNEYLVEFSNCLSFEKQTEILMDVFKYMNNKEITTLKYNGIMRIIATKNINSTNSNINNIFNNIIKNNLIESIDENNFIIYNESKGSIDFSRYNKNQNQIISFAHIPINEKIYSISLSSIEKKIFLSTLNIKKIKIIDYDLKNNIYKLNQNEMSNPNNFQVNSFYHKCIQLSKELFATSDPNVITIWSYNKNNYSQKKTIDINGLSYSMLLIDNNYFIFALIDKKSLGIIDINNLKLDKIINIIDCKSDTDSLRKINNKYVLINGYNGIGIFSIESRELVQYTKEFHSSLEPIIAIDYKNNIYILNKYQKRNDNMSNIYNNNILINNLSVYQLLEGTFKKIKEYVGMESQSDFMKMIILSKSILLLAYHGYDYELGLFESENSLKFKSNNK